MHIFHSFQAGLDIPIGGVRHAIELAENLQKLGHQVYLFVLGPGRYQEKTTLNIIYVRAPRLGIKAIDYYLRVLFFTLYILYYSLKVRVDVLYAREALYTFHTVALAKVLKIPHILEVNGFYLDEIKWAGGGWLRLASLKFCSQINLRFSHKIITVTAELKDKLNEVFKIPRHKIVYIDNGVNIDRCCPMDSQTARRNLGFDPESLYIGFIGYFFPWSGVDCLIKAASGILQETPNTRFVIIGFGSWGKHLELLAEKMGVKHRFVFTGAVSWDKVSMYLNTLDIGVAPYIRQRALSGPEDKRAKPSEKKSASSLKVFEYMACGKPVVVSEYEGIGDIVRESQCGLVIPGDDPVILARAIIKLSKDPALREQMGKNGRRTVVERFSWAETARKTEKVLLKI